MTLSKIDKDDAEKFVDDKRRSPKSAEHWVIDKDISAPAKKVLADDRENYPNKPSRYLSFDDLKKIGTYYKNQKQEQLTNQTVDTKKDE